MPDRGVRADECGAEGGKREEKGNMDGTCEAKL